ncbi:hypothetical protein BHU72_06740 [Desulfuribacillus stibiiarsenatis]|uniref:Helicase SNF2 n=1 Tax=Desulfuribacillus stibiiarsenatis TaxID=1390249 RepID=A0A1E5L4H5_9FIRM|nr:hypothetical protein BHU72_06740 [Desulfuribacillus stibiiarsenatis]
MYITEDTIRNRCVKETTFDRGKNYYHLGKVDFVNETDVEGNFQSVVSGSDPYNISLEFNKHGVLERAKCDCPAFFDSPGHCKHIVASLFSLKDQVENPVLKGKEKNQEIEQILDFFHQSSNEENQQLLDVEWTFSYEVPLSYYRKESSCSLSMRIGVERMYNVSHIEKFLHAIWNKEEYSFSKKFSYTPWLHRFSEQDQLVIDLLLEIFEHEKIANTSSFVQRSIFQGKKVQLSRPYIIRLFDLFINKVIHIDINQELFPDVPVIQQDIPITFELTQVQNDLQLTVRRLGKIASFLKEGGVFFYQHRVYVTSEQQSKKLIPLLTSFEKLRSDTMRIPETYKQDFVSGMLQHFKIDREIEVDKKITEQILQLPLHIKVFLDAKDGTILCDLQYHYGETVVKPFSENNMETDSSTGKILIRDLVKERQVMWVFEELEFQYNGQFMYLEDDERIYSFLFESLQKLQPLADIYYSDHFRSIHRSRKPKAKGKVVWNHDINILEVSFDMEGILLEELPSVLAAIQEKKQYHRLKDGSFLSLHDEDSSELLHMARLQEELQLKKTDWDKPFISLPLHQAMYLEQMNQQDDHFFDTEQDFNALVQRIKEPSETEYVLPEQLQPILRPYQKVGFQWLRSLAELGFGGILADDMGLGKTLQAISFILSLHQERQKEGKGLSSLVIAPTSLVYNWQSEFQQFAPELQVVVVSGNQVERQSLFASVADADVVVTSYPLIRRDIEFYKKIAFATCILDEAQFLKNHLTLTAQSVKLIRAKSFFALTGTPVENSINDLWSIFDLVLPKYLPPIQSFQRIYGNEPKNLSKRVKPFILRRLKADVLKELPPKIENKLVSILTDEQKKLYLAYLEQIKGQISSIIQTDGFNKGKLKILAALTRLRQICCHPGLFIEDYAGESGKLQQLKEILGEMIAGGHRILIFSQFSSMLKIIREVMEQEEYRYFYLDGSTPAQERMAMAQKFNEGERDIFLISLKAGGTGLNLTGADTVILYDLWWNPAVEDQAADRAHRIGQEKVVQVIRMVTQGTIEEKIYELQQKKREMIQQVVQSGETLLTKLSEQEILDLLSLE